MSQVLLYLETLETPLAVPVQLVTGIHELVPCSPLPGLTPVVLGLAD